MPEADPRKVRLRDVAELSGVSPATASRILRGLYTGPTETRDKVFEVVRATGYEPNSAARQMRTGTTGRVGIVTESLSDPEITPYVNALVAEAATRGLVVLLWTGDGPARPGVLTGAKQVDGILHVRSSSPQTHAGSEGGIGHAPESAGSPAVTTPTVFLNGTTEDLARGDLVRCDEAADMEALVRLFADAGRWRVALVGDLKRHAERVEALRDAVRTFDLSLSPSLMVDCSNEEQAASEAIVAISADLPPDGIIALTDVVALGVIDGLRSLGLSVPGHTWVVGNGNLHASALPPYQLTTLQPPYPEMAARAFDLLEHRLRDRVRPPEQFRLASNVMSRVSTTDPLLMLARDER
jgi:LacI family transcriptional regulator